ncbi:hypothetical protein KY290_000831 [Solanum tuberosum]|uniref:Uncharacterized protein n=1 Tax=Solanum tuberosum TaxID=4113 RepID=A0ABQ7WKL2_SOLTU|nr:hypothetical protein KY290_000831 [Solanum tuberosum]
MLGGTGSDASSVPRPAPVLQAWGDAAVVCPNLAPVVWGLVPRARWSFGPISSLFHPDTFL